MSMTQLVKSLEEEISDLRALVKDMAEGLGWFLEDERFRVAIGGNPHVVEKMLADAHALLARARETG